MNKKTKEFLESAEQFVDDLEKKPEKRMNDIMTGDEVFFLQKDAEGLKNDKGEDLYNCGVAIVTSLEDSEGNHKDFMNVAKIHKIHLKSYSYPFELDVEVKNIIRNYTAEERK